MKKVILVLALVMTTMSAHAGESYKTIKVENIQREFLERIPEKCKSTACALVFVFHGGGGNPEQIETHSGFTKLAEKVGFAVVYPNGLSKQWNDGRDFDKRNSDDLAFVDAMIADLRQRYKIELKKIFATGMSSGGFMSFLLGCERSQVFAAVAPVSASLSIGKLDHCAPAVPVSFFNIVGKSDTAVPYEGGRIKVLLGIKNRGSVLSSDESIKILLKADGCNDKAVVTKYDRISKDETSVEDASYTEGCRNKTEIRRISVVGGGHAWPGHIPEHRRFLPSVVTSEELDATDEIWKFFVAHPKL